MRDRVERMKLLSVQELEAQQAELLDSLAAVRVALSERATDAAVVVTGPVAQRISSAFLADVMRTYERSPVKFAKGAAITVLAIGFLIMSLFNAG